MSCGLVRKEAVSSRSVGAEGPAPWSVVPWAANSAKLNFAVRMGCGACGLMWPSQTVPEEPVPVVNEERGGGRWLQRRPWRCTISLFVLRTPGKTAAFGDSAAAGSASRPWCRLSNGTDSGPELGGTAGSRQGGTAAAVRDLQLGTAAGFEQTNAPSGSSDAGRACVLHP